MLGGLAPPNGGSRSADNSAHNQQRVAEVEQSGLHEEPPFPTYYPRPGATIRILIILGCQGVSHEFSNFDRFSNGLRRLWQEETDPNGSVRELRRVGALCTPGGDYRCESALRGVLHYVKIRRGAAIFKNGVRQDRARGAVQGGFKAVSPLDSAGSDGRIGGFRFCSPQ